MRKNFLFLLSALLLLKIACHVSILGAFSSTWIAEPFVPASWDNPANWDNGVPGSPGDRAYFPGDHFMNPSLTLDKDITLSDLSFGHDFVYSINGSNTITFSQTPSLTTENAASSLQVSINVPIILDETLDVHVVPNASLSLQNSISGVGGLNINGQNMSLSGSTDNVFSGSTYIYYGSLNLNKNPNIQAIGGNIEISGFYLSPAIVSLSNPNQIINSSNMTLSGGTFQMNGHTETIRSLDFQSGNLSQGGGILSLESTGTALALHNSTSISGPIHLTSLSGGNITKHDSGTSTISGSLDLGSTQRTFNILDGSGVLNISGNITNSGGINKQGAGLLQFSGSSKAYSGETTISLGTLSLGAVNQLTNSAITIDGGIFNINAHPQNLKSLTYNSGTLTQGGAPISLTDTGNALTMRDTIISGNILLTSTSGGHIVFDPTNNGTAEINGNIDLGSIPRVFNIPHGSAAIDMRIAGDISGSGGLDKQGNGILSFSNTLKTYTGNTTITDGTLQLGVANQLNPSSAVYIAGGTFDLNTYDQTLNTLTFTSGNLSQGGGILSLESAGTALALYDSVDISGPLQLTSATGGNIIKYASDTATISGSLNLGSTLRTFNIQDGSGVLNISGNITNSGGINKQGAGLLQFSGSSKTYSGQTTISEGTLSLDAVNQLTNSAITIDGGTFDTNTLAQNLKSLTYNSGTLSQGGAPITLTDTGNALTMRDTIISGDILLTSISGGHIVFDPTNNGTAEINGNIDLGSIPRVFNIPHGSAAIDMRIAGDISGSGGLEKQGNGILSFSSTPKTYTGTTTISEGTLQLGVANQLNPTSNVIINGGNFNLNSYPQSLNSLLITSGTLDQTGALLTLTSSGTALAMQDTIINYDLSIPNGDIVFDSSHNGTAQINGNIDLGGQIINLNIDNGTATIDMNIAGVISNGGLNKLGAGKAVLTGINTYTGPTTIIAGVLAVNGSLKDTALTINNGGILQGTGTIGTSNATVINNGEIHPGNSIGTLTINGTFTQNSDALLEMEILNASNYDQLIVNNGAVNILGGDLILNFLPGHLFRSDDLLTLIDNTSGTGIEGTFSTIINQNLNPIFKPIITYNQNNIVLTFEAPLDYFPSFSQMAFSLIQSPLIYLDHHLVQLRQELLFSSLPSQDSKKEASLSFAPNLDPSHLIAANSQNSCKNLLPPPGKLTKRYNAYIAPIGSLGHTKKQSKQNGSDLWSAGAISGIDALYNHSSWGVVASYEKLKAKVNEEWGSLTIDAISINSYGTYSTESLKQYFIDAWAGLGYQWDKIHRNAVVNTAIGTPKSFSCDASLGTGYAFMRDSLTFTPRISLNYMGFIRDAYKEHGAGLENLSYKKQSFQSLRPTVSFSAIWNTAFYHTLQLFPELHLRYQRELFSPDKTLSYAGSLVSGTANLPVLGGGRDFVFVGGSLKIQPREKIFFEASYDFEWNSHFQTHYLYLGLNYSF